MDVRYCVLAVLFLTPVHNLCSEEAADSLAFRTIGERKGIGAVTFSPDGKRIAGGGFYKDKSYLWDVETGKELTELADCGGVMYSISFSMDGKILATTALDTEQTKWRTVIWNGLTGKRLMELPPNLGWRSAVAPDGKSVAVATLSGQISFFQLPRGQAGRTIKTGAQGGVQAMCLSSDGKSVAAAYQTQVQTWDVRTGRPLRTMTADSPVQVLAFTPDGKSLVGGSENGSVTAWQVAAPAKLLWKAKPYDTDVRWLAVTPDGTAVAAASHDDALLLLRLSDGTEHSRFERQNGEIQSVAITADGSQLAVGESAGITLWPLTAQGARSTTGSRPETGETRIPADAIKWKGHHYAVIRDQMIWYQAKKWCADNGGHLATFETQPERELILKMCREAQESAWLGATDDAEEGTWMWVDGKPVQEAERNTWSLDNQNSAQHYLSFWKDVDNFDDAYGGERLLFICEWDQ